VLLPLIDSHGVGLQSGRSGAPNAGTITRYASMHTNSVK